MLMKIAYFTNCFGTQSHTFIRREIRELRKLGLKISLFGVRRDVQPAQDAEDVVKETQYLYPVNLSNIIGCNLSFLASSPFYYIKGTLKSLCSTEFGLKRRFKMLYHYFVAAKFAKIMQVEGITHIHAHFMNVSASIAMYASYHSQLPFSITVHSAGTFKTPHILGMHQKLHAAQFLMMISQYNLEYFDQIEPCRQKSSVIRCGMNLDEFVFHSRQDFHKPLKLLAVGRFVQKKGFVYLINAAKQLFDEGFDFELSMVGDGPLLEELRDISSQLGLDKQVRFMGNQSTNSVKKLMQASDVVIVPSVTSDSGEKEGLPVVIMEAMASGIAVIASDHSGIHEIVKNGVTGILTQELQLIYPNYKASKSYLLNNSIRCCATMQILKLSSTNACATIIIFSLSD